MKQFEFRELRNEETFDPTTICEAAPFTQAGFYGDWQKSLGRTVKRFSIRDGREAVAFFQLIKYPLLAGKNYLYAPYGPVIKNFSDDFFANLKKELTDVARKENAVFVRLDFTPPASNEVLSKFFAKTPLYAYRSAYSQPRSEWFLGLEKPENELLAAMHEKTRYAIRLAERKEVEAEIVAEDFERYFEIFYELMAETAKRNGFCLHQKEYYENIFQNLHKTNSFLSIVRYGRKILAIDLIVIFGKTANYIFGGSSNEERNRMPTYLAHWRAVCRAKRLGCADYNFGGIDAGDKKIYRNMGGVTVFKKKFGGREVRHSDFFDLVASPAWYRLYNFRKFFQNISL